MTELTRIGGHCGCGEGKRLEDRWVCTGCPNAAPEDRIGDAIDAEDRAWRSANAAYEEARLISDVVHKVIDAEVGAVETQDEAAALADRLTALDVRYLHEEWLPRLAKVKDRPAARGWGVYLLFDDRDTVFYVGMSGTPKKRLAKHRREFGDLIARVEWRPTEDRRSALNLETELIAELDPRMNIAKVTT